MKIDNKTIRNLGLAAAACVVLAWVLANAEGVGQVFGTFWRILFPFVLGFIFAFLFNIPMSALEKGLFKNIPGRGRRLVGFFTTLIIFISFLAFIFFLVVPQLVQTIATLGRSMPGYIAQWELALQPYLEYLPSLQEWIDQLNVNWDALLRQAANWLSTGAGGFFSSIFGVASSIVGGVVNFFIGIIFAFYLLLDKEHMSAQVEGLLKAWLPLANYERLLHLSRLVSTTYSRFIGGQCTEALIVGVIYVMALSIGRFSYPLLIGVLVGITTLIPLIGAYLGCVIGAFFILVSMGFWRTIAFIIMFVVIQQIEGNLIYPHVVGNSVGLPPVWIMVAVIVGGGIAGIFGALVFIPLFSVVYTLVRQASLARLKAKGFPSPSEVLPRPEKTRKHRQKKPPPSKGNKPEDH